MLHTLMTAMTPTDIVGGIVEILVGGITEMATGIGGGLNALVESLALNADKSAFSNFAGFAFAFGGVALAIGAGRLIVNMIRRFGK